MKSLYCGRWALTCEPSIRGVAGWLDRLVSKRKTSGCRRRSENVCYYPQFGKRIRTCSSLRMGSAVESKYSRPRAAERFTWLRPCSLHCARRECESRGPLEPVNGMNRTSENIPRKVSAKHFLDFDDVGAEIARQHGTVRYGERFCPFDDKRIV